MFANHIVRECRCKYDKWFCSHPLNLKSDENKEEKGTFRLSKAIIVFYFPVVVNPKYEKLKWMGRKREKGTKGVPKKKNWKKKVFFKIILLSIFAHAHRFYCDFIIHQKSKITEQK